MFFALSKVLGALTDPMLLITLALLVAWPLGRSRYESRRRAAMRIVGGTALFLAAITVSPLAEWAAVPLEDRFPAPKELPARVDGFIVLGGATVPAIGAARGRPELNAAADRLFVLWELTRHHPEALVVATGGSGLLLAPDLTEDVPTGALLKAMGIPAERILLENRSRNTRENAVFGRELLGARAEGVWVLVTSAAHMPRAMGVFRAIGWSVVPFPVDYRTEGAGRRVPRMDPLGDMEVLSGAVREWVGLVVYHLRGWTDDWFPAPDA